MQALTLISRTYCHLCHDMEEALKPLLDGYQVTLTVVDVDAVAIAGEALGADLDGWFREATSSA